MRFRPFPLIAPAVLLGIAAVPFHVSSSLSAEAPPLAAAASAGEEPVRERAGAALAALAGRVTESSHPDALRRAFLAYYVYRADHPQRVRKPYLYFVDYGLDSHTPRGYVFDMQALRLVEGPFTVAHGRGSAPGTDPVPTRFSNVRNSNASSLGLFLAQETYAFRGRFAGGRYESVGLRLQGLSGAFNNAALARGIVVHGAPYVTAASAGRSEGCPAMEEERAQRLLPRLSNGGLVYLFSPRDERWMQDDPWTSTLAR
jgi:hypothetical protein